MIGSQYLYPCEVLSFLHVYQPRAAIHLFGAGQSHLCKVRQVLVELSEGLVV